MAPRARATPRRRRSGEGGDRRALVPADVESLAWAVTVAALAAWGLHWLWGPGLPPGVDVTGHLTRLDVGLDLFASGRLDGWFDRAMLGYQTFLVYGPGLALAVAVLRVATLGLLSTPGALEVVAVASLVALAPAAAALTRSLGGSAAAGRIAGLLALAASSTRGGGIAGAFDLGLLPNTLAAPLVLWGWALALSPRPRPLRLGLVVVAIGITHPQSLVLFVAFLPLVLAAGAVRGLVDQTVVRPLAQAAAIAAGLGAWWWLPAFLHRDLRGVLTSWDLPTFADHLELIALGERGWIGPSALLVLAVCAFAAVVALVERDAGDLALVALPVVALASLHLVEWALADRIREVVLLPNRGLTYACYLAVPVVGITLARWVRAPALAWVLTAAVVAVTLPGLRPPDAVFDRPTAALRATADSLADEVPDGGRFAVVYAPGVAEGVPAIGRWLGWASGRADLGPFGAEYAPGVGLTLLVFEPPARAEVDEWIGRLRPLAVTHVVTGEPESTATFARSGLVEEVARHDDLVVWAMVAPPIFDAVRAEPEHLEWDVDLPGERQLPLPVGWSPGWSARIDGEAVPTTRTPDGRTSIPWPGGAHRVALDFSLPSGHLAGRLATVVAVVVLVVSPWARVRPGPGRRSRGRPARGRSGGSPAPR